MAWRKGKRSQKNIFHHTKLRPLTTGVEDRAITQDANEAALQEFEAGVRRSLKQADAGLVKTFKTKGEFSNHLKNPE